MNFINRILEDKNPEALEVLYDEACTSGEEKTFVDAIVSLYESNPDDVLIAAWYFRFKKAGNLSLEEERKTLLRKIDWGKVSLFSTLTGLCFWGLSDSNLMFFGNIPYFLLLWSQIAVTFVIFYFLFVSKRNLKESLVAVAGLIVLTLYVLFLSNIQSNQTRSDYLILMIIHLLLLSWGGIVYSLAGWRVTTDGLFGLFIKSMETVIVAGVFVVFGVVFVLIITGLFSAIGISIPDNVARFVGTMGLGGISVIAVAIVYNPHFSPSTQDFSQGIAKFVFTLMRLFLPISLIVLLIYLAFIPFHFMEPFHNRDTLIVYNVMLFAIVGLLMGATPMSAEDLSEKTSRILRVGILVIASLTLIIGLYALAAIIYRTVQAHLTINRFAVIGWNVINIYLIGNILYRGIKARSVDWPAKIQEAFRVGINCYFAWTLILLIFLPLFFR